MKENSNKALAFNTIILYIKLAVDVITGLFITRFSLQALGIIDYGLFSVLGGIISFIAILNTIMVSTSNRFIAVAIGKGVIEDIREQFNVNLVIHIGIAIICLLIAYPIGDWYIDNHLNYDGDIGNAFMVFRITVLASVISFVGVPYRGLLTAKERFFVFCIIDIIMHIVKLAVVTALLYWFSQKLLIYTLTLSITTATPTLVYIIYCNNHFREICQYKFCRKREKYKEVFNFSAWVGIGAIATVGKNQGAAIVINLFFDTVMNAALGVANIVNSVLQSVVRNVASPMSPQINKNYATGNFNRYYQLLVMSIKYSYLVAFVISIPFLADCDWILKLWLGSVPEYASTFITLFIVDILVMSLNTGVGNLVFASGKLSLYQTSVSLLNISSVIIAYFVLRQGAPAYALFYVYIAISAIRFIVMQWILHRLFGLSNRKLIKDAILPSILVTGLFLPSLLLRHMIHGLGMIFVSFVLGLLLVLFIGLTKMERNQLLSIIKKMMLRFKR